MCVYTCVYVQGLARARVCVYVCMMEYYKVLSRKQFVSVSDGFFIMTNRREPHLEIQRLLPLSRSFYLGRTLNFNMMKS